MYINSKHLQILKTIKNNQVSNIKDISDIFLLSNQHAKLYLEDIYCELFKTSSCNLKSEITINKIKYFSNAKNILKNSQQLTKNQKIFYLIFRLIKDKHIKLSHVCEELNLTKRNLNNYLKNISTIFSLYNLKLNISNKGIMLIGTPYSIKKFKFLLMFKMLVEKEFLSRQLRNEIVHFMKINDFSTFKNNLSKFFKIINCDFIKHSEISLFAFYSSFINSSKKQQTVADISFNKFLIYRPQYYDYDFSYKIFNFLKSTIFKNIPTIYLNDFFNMIDSLNPTKDHFDKTVRTKSNELRDIFAKYLGSHIYTNTNFFRIVNPWVNYSYLKILFYIDDSSFLDLNLNYFIDSNICNMTQEIKKILPSFTFFESIFLWYYFSENENKEIKNIFIFKNLPATIIPSLINEIYKKHNIKIIAYMNLKEFKQYKKFNSIDTIITVENFKIYNNNIPIKNLFFPIPNFKKVVSI
ncbi:MAG: helix-turn-helix domain-containing protein [Cetobacterium sp.]|uniref:helix-turn-helix domain-containing protein n=1 Tax=Cetobacterium sp. TaxID=2071632 RepID=UPI003F2E1AD4